MVTSTMTNNIRAVLSPLLIISYVFGTRIVEFPASVPRPWLSRLYIALLWSAYHFLIVYTNIFCIHQNHIVFWFCFWLDTFTVFVTIVLGMYYDKKFRNCLRKLDIVDNTLEKLGIITNYHKLYVKILLIALGLLVYASWVICSHVLWHGYHSNMVKSFGIAIMLNYVYCINLIDDLILTSTFGYIGLKFDQVNEYLQKLESDKEHVVKRTWEHSALFVRRVKFPKSTSSEYNTWIVMHLYFELRKISREFNSIFGSQMVIKMGAYFAFTALGFNNVFDIMLGNSNFHKGKQILIFLVTILFVNMLRLLIINYTCEKVGIKANAIGDVISRISYSTYDVVVRENISIFLLQMSLAPLKVHGQGLFQFGLKFFHGFTSSITTVIVILVQSNTKT